ncbi:hypothetical protein C8J57DRAFT_1060087 [Mycena rebaudengoi]|nr:hypothetical protein C8J57DRAFT_1060087 [Mycena rebaudengoi]
MFNCGKSALAYASIMLALVAQASAHAVPVPVLGVKGTPVRNDVQRPSAQKPCGNGNLGAIDAGAAVPLNADGTATFANFNAGGDGSTSVSVTVDATGKGANFVPGTVTKNGNANPTKVQSDQITISVSAGTKCTGGAAGNLCLVSVKTTSGFGGCTVL